MRKKTWEKYLQICEGVNILHTYPSLFMLTIKKNVTSKTEKWAKDMNKYIKKEKIHSQ